MEDLARIEARLGSLEELGELVGALRSMAAARAREAQDALVGTRAYSSIIERAIASVAPANALQEATGSDGRPVLLLIASENGFVGGFNARMSDVARQARSPDERLMIVGRRGEIAAMEDGLSAERSFAMTSRVGGIGALARRVTACLSDVRSARIAFARHQSGARYAPVVRQVLPLVPISEPASGPAPTPLFHLPPDALIAALAREYLFAELAHALMESLASENAARMQAMDAASRNIDDRLEMLKAHERAARQEKTTSDMLDVVTGAEAVNQRPDPSASMEQKGRDQAEQGSNHQCK